MNKTHQSAVEKAAEKCRDEAVMLLQSLVRIPSLNHPPGGDEKAVQEFYADWLASQCLQTEMFEADDVPGFKDHPGRLADHDMRGRPDVVGVMKGSGGGRSLMLLAHADVEQPGDANEWMDKNPWSGALRDGKVYGRGSGDDKSGMAINAMVPCVLKKCGVRLKGDLVVGSVSDEEQGGANGTVAFFCKGHRTDACIFSDGCEQEICVSNLGGGGVTVDMCVPAPATDAKSICDFFEILRRKVEAFKKQRAQKFLSHPHYRLDVFRETSTVSLTRVELAVDTSTRGRFRIWFALLPGEDPREFKVQLERELAGPDLPGTCTLQWMSRFLLPSEVDEKHPFVTSLANSFQAVVGRPAVVGGSVMSDMGMANRYGGYPCVIFGPIRWGKEGAAHQHDEFIEVNAMMNCLKTIVFCAMDWCGYAMA